VSQSPRRSVWGGEAVQHQAEEVALPEFEDCRKVAEAAGVPLKQVMAAAQAALGWVR
jgi:uncharacterized protein (DUF111 family)